MNYDEFCKRLAEVRPRILHLVQTTEARFTAGDLPQTLQPVGGWPFSSRVWRGFYQNAFKLWGVRRIRGAPYATHPTAMAYMLLQVLGANQKGEESAFFALFHDYLEEGDGRSSFGVEQLKKDFADKAALEAAVILSEPEIHYDAFPYRRRSVETVAYVVQAVEYLAGKEKQPLANAGLADKLDNIHDLDYILRNERYTAEKKVLRLTEKLAIFSFVAETVGEFADQNLLSLLNEAIEQQGRKLEVSSSLINAEKVHLYRYRDDHSEELKKLIEQYHNAIGFRA